MARLVCFQSFSMRDDFFSLIRYEMKNGTGELRSIARNYVDTYVSDATEICSCVIRVPGGKPAFLREIGRLSHHFGEAVVVFHALIQALDVNEFGPHVICNPAVLDIERICNVRMSDESRYTYAHLMIPPVERPRALSLIQSISRQAMVSDELEHIFNQHHAAGEDVMLQRALQASRDEEEARQLALSRTRVSLQEGWQRVLRAAEPKVVGQPLCIVCLCNRASICLVECGHQVMCDACVEVMWTRGDVKHNCPVCQAECTIIVRPITSEIEKGNDEDGVQKKTVKRRKK